MALSILVATLRAQGSENVVPKEQEPTRFPPPTSKVKAGTGKFVIFTREPTGKDWDFIAAAWECIPSHPEIPVTKRAEFGHSSWNCDQLLNALVQDDSYGMYPRFVRLQVGSSAGGYTVNLYDINYRTWEVRRIWQGPGLSPFGVIGGFIFCSTPDSWLLINAASGKLSYDVPFTPLETDGDYWLVRKIGETRGCWSYDRIKGQYVAHFGAIDKPTPGFFQAKLSPDGRSRASLLAPVPSGWSGGTLPGRLILQSGSGKDVSVPVEIQATPGSGLPVIPLDVELKFSAGGKLQLRSRKGANDAEDQVWTIDIATGTVTSGTASHSQSAKDADGFLGGVQVPDYLRQYVRGLEHFGRGGLAPAFFLHAGILKKPPEYPDCTTGVSRDGRHVLYRARAGSLAGVFFYGDLLTKQTVRWESPAGLDLGDPEEFVWVETPD
jgi:hypothetical protein